MTRIIYDYEFQNGASPKIIFAESDSPLKKFLASDYGVGKNSSIVGSDFQRGFDVDFRHLPTQAQTPQSDHDTYSDFYISMGCVLGFLFGITILFISCRKNKSTINATKQNSDKIEEENTEASVENVDQQIEYGLETPLNNIE